MMKILDKIMGAVENSLGVIFLALMVIVVFMQVVMRYCFNHALDWSEEVARYLMIWCTCLGIASGVRAGSHIGIQALVDALPQKPSYYIRIICDIFVLAIFVFITYIAILFAQSSLISGQLTPSTQIPIFFIYVALPFAFVLSIIRQVQVIVIKYVLHKGLSGEDYTV